MIKALGTKIVIERVEQEQKSAMGIVLSNMQDPNPWARVISIGADVKLTIKDGDLVVVAWNSVAEKKDQGKTYYIVDETGCFGVNHD